MNNESDTTLQLVEVLKELESKIKNSTPMTIVNNTTIKPKKEKTPKVVKDEKLIIPEIKQPIIEDKNLQVITEIKDILQQQSNKIVKAVIERDTIGRISSITMQIISNGK